jgi:hypothetical protein
MYSPVFREENEPQQGPLVDFKFLEFRLYATRTILLYQVMALLTITSSFILSRTLDFWIFFYITITLAYLVQIGSMLWNLYFIFILPDEFLGVNRFRVGLPIIQVLRVGHALVFVAFAALIIINFETWRSAFIYLFGLWFLYVGVILIDIFVSYKIINTIKPKKVGPSEEHLVKARNPAVRINSQEKDSNR